MSREAELAALVAQIRDCRICRETPNGPPLPHPPRPVLRVSSTARLLIAGQAPGVRVHRSGLPFDDPSGERLRGWMGIGRAEFYDSTRVAIAAMGFCFPGHDAKGGDLPPRRE
jgi:uracil-DNA glycosylase